jgi:hypothetical protein
MFFDSNGFFQSTPWFSKMFSRNRFQLILRFFHLVDNTKTPQRNTQHYNPAAWFKPLIDHANIIAGHKIKKCEIALTTFSIPFIQKLIWFQ